MSEPFLGQIVLFAGNFAPRGWATCEGQLLAIGQNQALFAILGTVYGGDGRTTFGLPDMRGRLAIHPGTGPGLSPRALGNKGGQETVSLNATQLPVHTHAATVTEDADLATADTANQQSPGPSNRLAAGVLSMAGIQVNMYSTTAPDTTLGGVTSAGDTTATGDGGAHNNIQPFQALNYIIALVGVFPSRN